MSIKKAILIGVGILLIIACIGAAILANRCPPDDVALEATSMSVTIYQHDQALESIMQSDDPALIEELLEELNDNYEDELNNSVPRCVQPTQDALRRTLEFGIQVGELKLRRAPESEIQASITAMDKSRATFDAEYYELTN